YQAENGGGNAHINPLRDRNHGRIYRVVYKNTKPYRPLKLSKDDPQKLVETLANDNLFWRLTAQRLLVERGKQDILPQLYDLIKDQSQDEIGINPGAIHALWTLHGLGALNGNNEEALTVATEALGHPSAGVRKAAVQTLPENWKSRDAILDKGLVADADLHTRLAAILSLANKPTSEKVGDALADALEDETNINDIWLSQALYIAAYRHKGNFLGAAARKGISWNTEAEKPLTEFEWNDPEGMTADWENMNIPAYWEANGLPGLDGEVWFYRAFEWEGKNQSAKISLGRINDTDESYLNGKWIGSIERSWDSLRSYSMRSGLLKQGANHLLVKVSDSGGRGGMEGDSEEYYISSRNQKVSLSGDWKFKVAKVIRQDLVKPVFKNKEDLINQLVQNVDKAEIPEKTASNGKYRPVHIKTVLNKMVYDQTEIELVAGETVEIIFENVDLMQHNLLISKPGTLNRVGEAADKLAKQSDGMDKGYIPDLEEIIFFISLTDPKQTIRKVFTVPDTPGDYPFICTFP
ncbi:MAG: dehydrogenase, partial [Bacteroidetes bacterium]|nr:dehydrogenase [Bacteroidota bacterium]